MSRPCSKSASRRCRLTRSPSPASRRYAAAASVIAGSEVDGKRSGSKPWKRSGDACSRKASISSATSSDARGAPLTSSSGQARTCRIPWPPSSARRATSRRSPTCVNGHTTSANTSIMMLPFQPVDRPMTARSTIRRLHHSLPIRSSEPDDRGLRAPEAKVTTRRHSALAARCTVGTVSRRRGADDDADELEELSDPDCLRLLRGAHLGRIAYSARRRSRSSCRSTTRSTATPWCSAPRTRVAARPGCRARPTAIGSLFEIDAADSLYHEGWSVLVVGRMERITEGRGARPGEPASGPAWVGPTQHPLDAARPHLTIGAPHPPATDGPPGTFGPGRRRAAARCTGRIRRPCGRRGGAMLEHSARGAERGRTVGPVGTSSRDDPPAPSVGLG